MIEDSELLKLMEIITKTIAKNQEYMLTFSYEF